MIYVAAVICVQKTSMKNAVVYGKLKEVAEKDLNVSQIFQIDRRKVDTVSANVSYFSPSYMYILLRLKFKSFHVFIFLFVLFRVSLCSYHE